MMFNEFKALTLPDNVQSFSHRLLSFDAIVFSYNCGARFQFALARSVKTSEPEEKEVNWWKLVRTIHVEKSYVLSRKETSDLPLLISTIGQISEFGHNFFNRQDDEPVKFWIEALADYSSEAEWTRMKDAVRDIICQNDCPNQQVYRIRRKDQALKIKLMYSHELVYGPPSLHRRDPSPSVATSETLSEDESMSNGNEDDSDTEKESSFDKAALPFFSIDNKRMHFASMDDVPFNQALRFVFRIGIHDSTPGETFTYASLAYASPI